MIINKKYTIILTLLVFTVIISSYASAFAVSSAYWKENPLRIYPGETREIVVTLQNLASPNQVNLKAEISGGSEVLILIDSSDIYSVPGGEKRTVNLRVAIPSNTQIGTIYKAQITFTTIAGDDSESFTLGSSINQKFDIIVEQIPSTEPPEPTPPEEETNTITTIIISAIIILAIIILWVIIKRKTKKK